jgi:endonuclease/exonuclease/phosphatase family metal-dependent hydrolase
MLGFRSATGGNEEGERAIATFPSFFPQGALDRIYYRGPLHLAAARRCRLALSRVASDHLPLIADFEL